MKWKTRVIRAVCREFEISPEMLKQAGCEQPMAEARQVAAYILKIDCGMNNTAIGALLGRTSQTIIHSIRRVSELASIDDPATLRHLEGIRERLRKG